jgi:hypothetical protein
MEHIIFGVRSNTCYFYQFRKFYLWWHNSINKIPHLSFHSLSSCTNLWYLKPLSLFFKCSYLVCTYFWVIKFYLDYILRIYLWQWGSFILIVYIHYVYIFRDLFPLFDFFSWLALLFDLSIFSFCGKITFNFITGCYLLICHIQNTNIVFDLLKVLPFEFSFSHY